MKFLCVPCDSPMTLQTVAPPDRGSLSVVYSCPECGYEIAMLTNQFETQIVQSLGVRIGAGPSTALGAGPGAREAVTSTSGSGCPFTAMIPAGEEGQTRTAEGAEIPIRWTPAAEARLAKIPEFVRPMARLGIEKFARDNGSLEVDEQILDAAREFFGM